MLWVRLYPWSRVQVWTRTYLRSLYGVWVHQNLGMTQTAQTHLGELEGTWVENSSQLRPLVSDQELKLPTVEKHSGEIGERELWFWGTDILNKYSNCINFVRGARLKCLTHCVVAFPVAQEGQLHWSHSALRAAIQGDCGQLMYDHIMPSFLLIFSEGKTSEASLENAVDSSRCWPNMRGISSGYHKEKIKPSLKALAKRRRNIWEKCTSNSP